MDESLKKKIAIITLIVSTIVLIVSLIGNYLTSKSISEQAIAVNRSPLKMFRLIGYREDSDGSFIDIVSTDNGKKYENIFISATCPLGKSKSPGLIMRLSAVEYFRPATNETFYNFDRAYDYICSNKNMEQEDEQLLKRIQEARERELKFQEPIVQPN
jgi:hypothetical protein